MVDEQFDEVRGIRWIILCPAGRERLAEPGKHLRVDRIKYKEVILEQCVDE